MSAEPGSRGRHCVAHEEYASIEIVPKAGNRCSDVQAASEAAQPCIHLSRIVSLLARVEVLAELPNHFAGVTEVVEEVGGRKPIPLESFVGENLAVFGGSQT